MRRAAYATNVFAQNIKATGRASGGAFGGAVNAATGLGVVIGGLGIAALKSAVEFESAFTGVTKTVDGTAEELDAIRTGILDLSENLPASAESIAGVAEAAGQLGIKTPDVLAFSKVMIDLGESTNLAADEAATSLARFANILQLPADQFDNIGSAIVDLGNNFATTEREIVDISLRFAAAGAQAGITAEDILGIATATSSIGVAAERGGTALSKTFFEINTAVKQGGEKLELFAQISGQTAADFAAAWEGGQAAEGFNRFVEGLGRLGEQGGDVSSTLDELDLRGVRVQQTLIGLGGAGEQLAEGLETANRASKENVALTEEANRRYATTASRLKIVGNEIKRSLIDAGTAALPDLLQVLEENADRLPEIFENLAEAGIKMLDALAAGLPVLETLAFVFSKMPTDILAAVGAFGILAKTFTIVNRSAAALTGGTASTALAGGPIGIALAAIGAIVLSGVSQGMDDIAESANRTKAAIADLDRQFNEFVAGTTDVLTFEGLNEEDFGGLDAAGSTAAQFGLFGPIEGPIKSIQELTKAQAVLRGEYELSEDALRRVGLTQSEFVDIALEGGPALDEVADKIAEGADWWGRWGNNARNAVIEAAREIRENAVGALEDLVAQGVLTEAQMLRIQQSTRLVRTETKRSLLPTLTPLGERGYTIQDVDVTTRGPVDQGQALEKARATGEAVTFIEEQVARLGLEGEELGRLLGNMVVNEDALPDIEAIISKLFEIRDLDLDYDATGLSDNLTQVVFDVSAVSDAFNKTAIEARVLQKFRLNPDLTGPQKATIIMEEFGVSLEEARESGALFNFLMADLGSGAGIDNTSLSVGVLKNEMQDGGEAVEDYAAAIEYADAVLDAAQTSLIDYEVSTLSAKDALIAMSDANAELGGALLNSLTQSDKQNLALALSVENYQAAADAANELGLVEQDLVNIQEYLTEAVEATSEAYRSSLPTIATAATELRQSLQEEYRLIREAVEGEPAQSEEEFIEKGTSVSGLLGVLESQQGEARDFTSRIGSLREQGFDDLAAAIVELSTTDIAGAQKLAEEAVSYGEDSEFLKSAERQAETLRVGYQVLASIRDEQALGLTTTNNEVLGELRDKQSTLATDLGVAWGLTAEQIRDAIGVIQTETENAPKPSARAIAVETTLRDLGGFDTPLEAAAALEVDPSQFDDELKTALARLAGYDDEQVEALLLADDSQAAGIISGILTQLGLITAEEHQAIIRANVVGTQELNDLVELMNYLSQGVIVPIFPTVEDLTSPQEANRARAQTGRGSDPYFRPDGRADGGVFDYYAQGGVKDSAHVAQIAAAGTWRVWAEPETGGEAYIPLSPAKRNRSEDILGEVARRFGYELLDSKTRRAMQNFADGGLVNAPIRPSSSVISDNRTTVKNEYHVSQPVNFQGDMTFADAEKTVEYAQRRRRMNSLVGT